MADTDLTAPTLPAPRRTALPLALLLMGALSLACWWRVQALGDPRVHLASFYGWFAAAFILYLLALGMIRRVARHRPSRPVVGTALLIIALVAVGLRIVMLGTSPTLSDDLYRYRWDGRVQQAGIDPYRYPPNAPEVSFLRDELAGRINFPHLRTVYPPLTELAFRLGASISQTLTAQKAVFVIAELCTVVALFVILGARGLSPLWIIAYAWHPLVILEIAGSGHNDALGIACLWLGVASWQAGVWRGSALAWAAAFLSKFLSITLAPWWWFRRQARGWLLAFLLLGVAPLLAHPTAITAALESLTRMTGRGASNASLYLAILRLTSPRIAPVIALGIWAAFLVWWARRTDDPVRYLLGALGFAALFSPALHPWYVVWIVPCFCFARPPWLVALTGSVVLTYTMWPDYLAHGRWILPAWAWLCEYVPVFILLAWGGRGAIRRQWDVISDRQSAISVPAAAPGHVVTDKLAAGG